MLAGCGGSDNKSSGIPKNVRDSYIAGCTQTGQTKAGCECLLTNLTDKQGVDSESKFKALAEKIKTATQSSNPAAALPPEFKSAAIACKSLLVRTPTP